VVLRTVRKHQVTRLAARQHAGADTAAACPTDKRRAATAAAAAATTATLALRSMVDFKASTLIGFRAGNLLYVLQ